LRNEDKYPDLNDLTKGSSFKQLFDFFYFAYICRYTTKEHLNAFNNKLGTPKKLKWLTDNGYLTFNKVYSITEQTHKILKDQSYYTLVKIPVNNFTAHSLLITDFLLKEFKRQDFYTALFPHFSFLIPDALIIYKKENAYKLVFLEIEEEKPNWHDYLNQKRDKYQILAKDKSIYEKWWKTYSDRLGLKYCTEEQFCFSVLCVGNIKKEWEGWRFERLFGKKFICV
jgi:hypothetical protein